jgi:hypothetical protein
MSVTSSSYGRDAEGKRTLGRPRCRWEDNVIMDLRELGREILYWIHLAQFRGRLRAL